MRHVINEYVTIMIRFVIVFLWISICEQNAHILNWTNYSIWLFNLEFASVRFIIEFLWLLICERKTQILDWIN